MKYIAIFSVPDDAEPDQYTRPKATFKFPHDYYKVIEADLKPLPKRCPEAWEDPRVEGWNALLDSLEA